MLVAVAITAGIGGGAGVGLYRMFVHERGIIELSAPLAQLALTSSKAIETIRSGAERAERVEITGDVRLTVEWRL